MLTTPPDPHYPDSLNRVEKIFVLAKITTLGWLTDGAFRLPENIKIYSPQNNLDPYVWNVLSLLTMTLSFFITYMILLGEISLTILKTLRTTSRMTTWLSGGAWLLDAARRSCKRTLGLVAKR